MRQTRVQMGMPITVEIVGARGSAGHDRIFAWFDAVDRRFSPYRADSELSALNRGEISDRAASAEMRAVLAIAEATRLETDGYFDIRHPGGGIDPSGIVKGWAILKAAAMLADLGVDDFFVDAGGDIQAHGLNAQHQPWSVGIRSPFEPLQVVKILYPGGHGVATSGSYVRGEHIYDPHGAGQPIAGLVSLTVIGPDVLEADRFATAAFAMGAAGIGFIEARAGLEGYAIDGAGLATFTSGFEAFTRP